MTTLSEELGKEKRVRYYLRRKRGTPQPLAPRLVVSLHLSTAPAL